ncbi:MAG TPA: LytTR family DNA-binding domain-containing protein [Salegentibacter sp.]|uniref:LytR/AlgR family response regulator transcription factor n=1 Tax=Salegentibacter sp. TaxID=1903072 RepID=UPI002F95EA90
MKVIIIEDEKPSARRLQRLLEKEGISVIATLTSVEEGVQWFRQNPHPDLILLDIQLSDGLSFEIFEEVEINSAIIFTTAYDEYALKAFKLNSIDYLLKPIDEEELETALTKFRTTHSGADQLKLEEIKALLSGSDNYKKRFTISVGQHLKIINTEDIACFYSENKATYLHTRENRSYLIDQSLEKLEPLLNPKDFYRVNRKFIINLKCIEDIISHTNQRFIVKLKNFNSEKIIVSRERVKGFKDWLK